jgi:PAS domain S-box-containing protein
VAVVVVLATVTALIGLLLIWRHGASVRITRVAEQQRARADALAEKSRFLASIADSQPRAILAVDARGAIRYANRRAGEEVGMVPESMVGHSLSEVYGRHRALPLADQSRQAREANAPVSATERQGENGDGREILSVHVPLGDGSGDTLILREDLTELADDRQRREDTLKGVMRTLLTLIDKRDPHAANQSVRAAEVARALAEELDLSEEETDTVTFAAALMNVGKILVARDILTRAAPLDAQELVSVKEALAESAALVSDVDFGGPVAETIARAHMFGEAQFDDGGDGTPRTVFLGRVVGLANGFVAMVSARAWRGGLAFDAALEELRRRAAGHDDTRIISALNHVLDNKGGRRRWGHFAESAGEPPGGKEEA